MRLTERSETEAEGYWRRKNQELDFLRSYAGAPPATRRVSDLDSLYETTLELRRAIRIKQVAESSHLSETSLEQAQDYEGAFGEVSYSYQRYDLSRRSSDWLMEIHGLAEPSRAVNGLFFSSGMGAIAAVMTVIAGRHLERVAISPLAYYETHLLNQRFFSRVAIETNETTMSAEADVLWLDTSSSHWPALPDVSDVVKLIVVDTTCVEADSTEVKTWLRHSQRLGVPVLLVRSHLKLDTFGLELARLGSVVVVAPDNDVVSVEPVLEDLRHARSGLGVGFELSHLYPWLGLTEFFKLSSLRTTGIREVTSTVAAALEKARVEGDPFEILLPPHGLFFLVKTGITFADADSAKRGDLSRAIASKCKDDHLPAFAAASFGLDRIAFLDFINMHDGLHYLRVSGADVPNDQAAPVGQRIREAVAAALGRP